MWGPSAGEAMRIAALYVATGGVYFGLPDVDPWDKERDARLYDGPWPVVAHPPCERWGRYWFGGPNVKERRSKGDDGGCFAAALDAVRTWGGVLEHPAASHAWSHFKLRKPRRGGWWMSACGGWVCEVEQGNYGHPARKKTWLYWHPGAENMPLGERGDWTDPRLPGLKWGASTASRRLDEGFHSTAERRAARAAGIKPRRRLTSSENLATPIPFRDLLLSLARAELFKSEAA